MALVDSSVSARSDARRNRERLVVSARELFAEAGVDVPAREISRAAGVGIGTLYRHFPTRDDLVDAVLEDAFEELIAVLEEALADPDPWRGFRRYVEGALVLYARNRGLKQTFETRSHGRDRVEAMRRRIRPLAGRLVAAAQDGGALRRDFSVEDIRLVLSACDRAAEVAGESGSGSSGRYLGFVLDGLRSDPR